jgi:hypothetical protein
MSSINWEEYVTKAIIAFRKEFEKFSSREQEQVREIAYDRFPFEPCQIEVLDFGVGKAVVCIVVHDKNFPDMMFKVHKDVKTLSVSEFIKKYKSELSLLSDLMKSQKDYEKLLLNDGFLHFVVKESIDIVRSSESPQQMAKYLIYNAKSVLKGEQVGVIERSTDGLKKSIAKISEDDIRNEMYATMKDMGFALREIKRLDDDMSKMRQLVGSSQEYQEWKLLVSDVDRLKGEHVPREVFDAHIERIDEKIDKGLDSLNTRIEKGLGALSIRIEDLKAIKFWSKRTILDIVLAIIATASTIIAALLAAGVLKF